jgi:uncharacterized protein (UPF0276 family)
MPQVNSSIACNLDADLLAASLPLFASGQVDAIEWSFDTLYKFREIPNWFTDLLQAFSAEKRLVGHGVYFSLFSGQWTADQQSWLDHLTQLCQDYQFDHITEHFGFMTGEDFHQGAPISVPYNATTLAIGRDRLKRIHNACACPVGLENLAFAYSLEEVKQHGSFLEELLAPVNGFLILDLHNLYCQLHNFSVDFQTLIQLYPLHLVREIHISGGSWESSSQAPANKVRRDTHDDAVPEIVFELLATTIPSCPNLQYVVLESLGAGLQATSQKSQFQQDFLRMRKIVQQVATPLQPTNNFLPDQAFQLGLPLEDPSLAQQQKELSDILEQATDSKEAFQAIQRSSLAQSDWHPEQWAPYMVETVYAIAQKWKKGFE